MMTQLIRRLRRSRHYFGVWTPVIVPTRIVFDASTNFGTLSMEKEYVPTFYVFLFGSVVSCKAGSHTVN